MKNPGRGWNSKITDEEFIELWRSLGSVKRLSERIGLDVRNVQTRRKRIEAKYGLKLHPFYKSGGVKLNGEIEAIQRLYSPRQYYEIKDGWVVVFSDCHYWPGIVTDAHKALIEVIKEIKPLAIVANGDILDGSKISRFARIGWERTPTVKEELDTVTERLEEIRKAAKGAKLFWPLGNHDARYETRLANAVPEYEKVTGFHLKDHFTHWGPCWSLWINNDLIIKHKASGGIHAEYNSAMKSGMSICLGHTHRLRISHFTNAQRTLYGINSGTLSDVEADSFVDYTEDSPIKDWRSGFAVLRFIKGRMIPLLVEKIAPGELTFRGEIIKV
jgi:predicted phosphodiesterase